MLRIEPFAHFQTAKGTLDVESLDEADGECSRREVLLRFLTLSAVLDQGPDIVGVRMLVRRVTEELYRRKIHFLHRPLLLFKNLALVLVIVHEANVFVTKKRAEKWAEENQSSAGKYNLFLDNSRQTLNYVVFRWGVPLSLPMLHQEIATPGDKISTAICDHLWSFASAEIMSQELKDNKVYGFGKALGDKAGHLFAKWAVSSFGLLARAQPNWGPLSYETPLDSNVGRVLWRSGVLLEWAEEKDYVAKEVIQRGKGKGGLDYIRVTNMRGMTASKTFPQKVKDAYVEVCCGHLCTHKRAPQKMKVQRLPNAYLLAAGGKFSIANLDDGLIFIGTQYCRNHENPRCDDCPLAEACAAANGKKDLIENYRT